MVLDYIINRMDSKDSLLHSESKGQVIYFTLLTGETPQQCCLAVRLSDDAGFSYNSRDSHIVGNANCCVRP